MKTPRGSLNGSPLSPRSLWPAGTFDPPYSEVPAFTFPAFRRTRLRRRLSAECHETGAWPPAPLESVETRSKSRKRPSALADSSFSYRNPGRWFVALGLGALLLSGCTQNGDKDSPPTSPTGDTSSPTPTSSVAVEDDGFTTLPVYLVGSQAYTYATPDDSRTTLTCGEAMVLINTVPVKTDEPVAAALEFLLESEQYYHGQPELLDPLKNAGDVKVDSVSAAGKAVTVELSGNINNPGWCQAAQMIAQLELTAGAAAGGKTATVNINGTPIREALGVAQPYAQGQDPQR